MGLSQFGSICDCSVKWRAGRSRYGPWLGQTVTGSTRFFDAMAEPILHDDRVRAGQPWAALSF